MYLTVAKKLFSAGILIKTLHVEKKRVICIILCVGL